MTQRQLAAVAGTAQAAIARYEGGSVLPDLRTTEDDVRRFVRRDDVELWDDLLSPHIRTAWQRRFAEQRAGRC